MLLPAVTKDPSWQGPVPNQAQPAQYCPTWFSMPKRPKRRSIPLSHAGRTLVASHKHRLARLRGNLLQFDILISNKDPTKRYLGERDVRFCRSKNEVCRRTQQRFKKEEAKDVLSTEYGVKTRSPPAMQTLQGLLAADRNSHNPSSPLHSPFLFSDRREMAA